MLWSIASGSKPIPFHVAWDGIFHFDRADPDHLIIRSLRVPRTIIGGLVGVGLGLAGTLIQGLTRNPLADPGILGVEAGASLFVVIGIHSFGIASLTGYVWFAFVGAAVSSVVVYVLGSMGRDGATPVKLALAGAAMTAFVASITSAILLLDVSTLDEFRFWVVGSLANRDGTIARQVAPFIGVGAVLALFVGTHAERDGARRRRRPLARPARRRVACARRRHHRAPRRWRHRRRRADRVRRPRRAARRPGHRRARLSLDPRRTRRCWPRSC